MSLLKTVNLTNSKIVQSHTPVNKETIFFGTRLYAKRLRELIKHSIEHMSEEDTYLIGLNGSNNKKIRKVIWAGKIKEVLTFVEAWERLRGESSYREMIKREYSPLHLRPILQRGNMIGYKQVSKMHIEEGKWILDIISSTKSKCNRNSKRFYICSNGSAVSFQIMFSIEIPVSSWKTFSLRKTEGLK